MTSVTAAYLQRNLRPQVRSITVYPPGIVFQKPFTTGEPELAGFEDQSTPDRKLAAAAMASQQGTTGSPTMGRRTYLKGLQTLVWKADDENDDELMFDVQYRREGETEWKALRKNVADFILVWDTTTVPNGTYFVKIVASDSPSNPLATALTGEMDSAAFEIDNSPPVISLTSVRTERARTVITFDVKDDHSAIKLVEFSEEYEFTRQYLAFEQLRYEDRLRIDLQIDPESFQFDVPPFSVQTLAENAVRHAIPRSCFGPSPACVRRSIIAFVQ